MNRVCELGAGVPAVRAPMTGVGGRAGFTSGADWSALEVWAISPSMTSSAGWCTLGVTTRSVRPLDYNVRA